MSACVNAPMPPCGPLEIVFSFDTTGSMYGYLDQVRGRLQDMIQRLQADIPAIRIAVFAHGDYCDHQTYVTKWEDFSSDVAKLCSFVSNVERTGGGDAPECYELVLRQARTELSWTPGSRRAIVLIGDDVPHEADYYLNTDNIDWREEIRELASWNVTVYGVQCGNNRDASPFYKTISAATDGKHLQLEDMGGIFDVMMAVCYREGNDTAKFANYEMEARARAGVIGPDVDAIFKSLRDEADGTSTAGPSVPAPSVKLAGVPKPVTLKRAGSSMEKLTKKSSIHAPKAPKAMRLVKPKTSKKTAANKAEPPTGLDKFKLKNLPRLKRENVPETNFCLRSMTWTPWVTAFVPYVADTKMVKGDWVKRFGRPGYRLTSLAPRSGQDSSGLRLFEVAVETSNKRRHVMFSRFSSRCMSTQKWQRYLLSSWCRSQVDNALGQGCRVMVRHCLLEGKSQASSVKKDIRRYDYAWSQAGGGVRAVVKRDTTLSRV
ncbi:uncharacterized protein LOC106012651 [Aplysia californica]|uniref:Uncharacterized protein LOC106012651 n=1 Tax=Aplysia californica TaxID=6500 RepID=A0ABM1A6C9_APLCA|nr:uncharacterized protein LOC106012651 [Aplysia californica]